MAKDINLTWTAPTTTADVDSIKIYRKAGDHTSESDMDVFRTGATLAATLTNASATSHIDTGVADGTYTYGAFSYNTGGFGPGDLIDTALVVA